MWEHEPHARAFEDRYEQLFTDLNDNEDTAEENDADSPETKRKIDRNGQSYLVDNDPQQDLF